MLEKRFFKTKDEVEVTFSLAVDDAKNVALVCEENGWEPIPMRYSKKKEAYQTKVRLAKDSEFQFRYLIDGQSWENDPQADAYRRNEFGGDNSVVFTNN